MEAYTRVFVAAYGAVGAAVAMRGAVGWFRAYDRHYPQGPRIAAREWAGIGLRSVFWPLSAAGASLGWAIDCARWAWAFRPRRKVQSEWSEISRRFNQASDGSGGELVIYVSGPKEATPYQARLWSAIRYGEPCEYDPSLYAHTIIARNVETGLFAIEVKYSKATTIENFRREWDAATQTPAAGPCDHNWLEVTHLHASSRHSREYVCQFCGKQRHVAPGEGVIRSVSLSTSQSNHTVKTQIPINAGDKIQMFVTGFTVEEY